MSDIAQTSPDQSVALPDPAELAQLRDYYDPALDFRKLAMEASYYARGFRLIEKDDLIGIPFIVISVIYREGYLNPEHKIKGDYVSLECVTADRETMYSPQTRALMRKVRDDQGANLTVYPNEPVVINDGGTGIRRSITEYLTEAGDIDPGGDPSDERQFDRPYLMWARGAEEAAYGIDHHTDGTKLRYFAMRGLRRSDYENEYGPGTTHYFA